MPDTTIEMCKHIDCTFQSGRSIWPNVAKIWPGGGGGPTYLFGAAAAQRQTELVVVVAVAKEAARRQSIVFRIDDSLERFGEIQSDYHFARVAAQLG